MEMVDGLHGYRIDYCVDTVPSVKGGYKITTQFKLPNYNTAFSFSLYEITLKLTHTALPEQNFIRSVKKKKWG